MEGPGGPGAPGGGGGWAVTVGVGVDLGALLVYALLLAAALWVLRRALGGGGRRREVVVFAGLSGSGKTTAFLQLYRGSVGLGTVPSMAPNEAGMTIPGGRPLRVLDYPGHVSLRPGLAEALEQARKVVVFVDATATQKRDVIECAELLHNILSDPGVARARVPVLLACNKVDNIRAQGVESLCKQLEIEMGLYRDTSGSLKAAGTGKEVGGERMKLGEAGKPLRFAECPSPVTKAGVSALKGRLKEVSDFLGA